MSNGDTPITPTDLTTAAIAAVNLILSQLGISPLDEILSLFSGKPKFDDTEAVIAAYQQSAYWPLHALASDMQIWVKNGAPISDSNPAVQASFAAAKQGTVESIQQLAGEQPGPGSPGYWTIFALIQGSWGASGYGEQQVLKYVKALDALTQVLTQQNTKPPPPPPPPPPPSPPPGGGGGGNGDLIQELIACLCDETCDECCTAVVAAIAKVAQQLAIIAKALTFGGKDGGPTPPPIDLSGVIAALQALVAAIGAYPPALEACCAEINASLGNIAKAIGSAPGADTKGIVDAINAFAKIVDVKPATVKYLVDQGFLDPQLAQVVQSADFGDWILGALRTAGWTAINWVWKAVKDFKPNVAFAFSGLTDSIAVVLSDSIGLALAAGAAPLYPEIKGIIDAVVNTLQPTGLPDIGNVNVDPDLLLSKTLAPVLIINAVTLIFDYFGWEISEQLKEYVDVAAELVGLQEIRELKVGQMMRFGPMREAELRAKGTYRQEMVGLGTMAGWTARGLYDPARYQGLAPLTGTPPEQVDPTLQAAYSGLGARRILPLIQTGLFSQADIADELTFSGLRPASMRRYLAAAPYLATQTERRSLISTLEKAYIAGLLADADLTGNIDSAENNTTRDNLILQRVKWESLIAETKELEAEYTTLYLGQLIDDATFRGYLGGIGLQPWKISIAAAKAEARLNATLHRKELAAAAALQRATAAEERKAAVLNFAHGNLDSPALGIALVATGLTATQAAAWVDLAVLQKAGGLRWKYGLQLPAPEATLLQQRVTALLDQRKRQQISDAQFVSTLQALNLPPNYINALRATADALLTPAKTAFAIPVQTG